MSRPLAGAGLAVVVRLSRAGAAGRRASRVLDQVLLLGPGAAVRARGRSRHRQPDRSARDVVYTAIWSQAAAAVGAEHHGLGSGFAELRRDGRTVWVRHQLTPLDDAVALALALDKPLSLRRLAEAGVPVTDRVTFRADGDSAAVALLDRTGCVVVKPAVGTAGGEGVTGGVRTVADLRRAALRARHWSETLLAERQVPGRLHRLLLLDGELLDVIVDEPPTVVGNGVATVEELLEVENDRRGRGRGAEGLELLEPDLDLVLALRHQHRTLSSIVPAGMRVLVKTITNDRGPDDSQTYRGVVHADVLAAARTAARVLGLRLAGIDVVAPDIEAPLTTTGGVVLEVNGAPGLHRHYQVADRGRATRVAVPVLERMLSPS